MTKDTGGSAFPVAHGIDGNWQAEPKEKFSGMTLRDWFAGQALQGYISTYEEAHSLSFKTAAKDAYAIADAMIETRNETEELPL